VSNRITTGMTARVVLSDIEAVSNQLSKTQQRLASGKQITVPSDDPFGTTRALEFRSELEENQQYQRNVQEASAWQDATDTALGSIGDFTLRARELLVQGATDTVSQDGRNTIASEIDQLIDSIKSEANTQYAGRYIFSGSQTLTAPYQQGAVDTYAGDNVTVKREIGRSVQVDLNVDGQSAIGDGSSGLIAALRKISADLRTPGTTAQLQGADLQALDAAHDTLTNVRSIVGARTNRLEAAQSRLEQLEGATTKLLSNTEDADMAQTLIDFSTQQAGYQAALKAGAQVIQPSLLDFLSN
jgi:flagellar hook-associated protein 3 FlgL